MWGSKLPNSEGADIVFPILGWRFPHTAVGVIEAYGTMLGVPMGMYWTWRHGRLSWFCYRHACVPYPDDVVAFYCQKFALPIASFKAKTHVQWQDEAVKSGLSGLVTFSLIAWNKLVSRKPPSSK